MKRYYLGIDQGTTGTTALLVDENWNEVAHANVEHTQIYPYPGWVEHDPEEIWLAVRSATEKVLKKAGVSPSQIIALGLDHQGETCAVWRKDTGKPVYNAIVWQDRRTSAVADVLNEKYGDMIKKRTGLQPDAYYSATKIQWLLNNVDGVREEISRGNIMAGTLDSYLIWKLSGRKVFVTDTSTASRTMMIDLAKGQWDQELLDIYGIPVEILPPIMNSSQIYGYTDPDEFFGIKIPIGACVTDALAAMFAQACLDKGNIKTTYGTGCFMYTNLGDEIKYSDGVITVAAWKINDKITYTFDGGVYIAGASIQWLRDKLRIIWNAAETDMIASSVPDTGGVYFVPAFSGLAAPHWDQYARGMIIGITGGTTREQIVRATLESIAFQVYDNAMAMQKDSGFLFESMKVDGGPVKNNFLMQFQADILGKPVAVPTVTEMTPYGSALMAALSTGGLGNMNDVRDIWKADKYFEPKMSKDEREARLAQWNRAVERCKNWATSDKGGF